MIAQSPRPRQNKNFVNTSKKILKNRFNFSRSAQFHTKTRVSLKYPVNDWPFKPPHKNYTWAYPWINSLKCYAIEPAPIPRPCHGTRNHSLCPIFCTILEKMHLPHCILLADKVLLSDWISGIRLIWTQNFTVPMVFILCLHYLVSP